MQNQKTEKNSIFSSLNVKLKFLMNWVELTQFSVESSRVELKIWAIRLESSWKYEQLDSILIQVQNVNSKLNLMINLSMINLIYILKFLKIMIYNLQTFTTWMKKTSSWK